MANNPITKEDLNKLEKFADEMFGKVGIDVGFTKHFLERVNDARNKKQITYEELTRLFREEYGKWGKKIAQLGPDKEAILKDIRTNINLPFALNWDSRNKELDLVAKTVMRKADFKSPDPFFTIAEEAPANAVGGGNIAGIGVDNPSKPANWGEPPKKTKRKTRFIRRSNMNEEAESAPIKHGTFAGNKTFIVPSSLFHKARFHKKAGKHWKTYIGEDEHGKAIREFARKNHKKAIVLQDENTGAMTYCKYGGK